MALFFLKILLHQLFAVMFEMIVPRFLLACLMLVVLLLLAFMIIIISLKLAAT